MHSPCQLLLAGACWDSRRSGFKRQIATLELDSRRTFPASTIGRSRRRATRSRPAIEPGIELSFTRVTGTSVRKLENTYFRELTRTDDQLRAALDAPDTDAV